MSALSRIPSRKLAWVVGLSLTFIALLGVFTAAPTGRTGASFVPGVGQPASPSHTQDIITIPQDDNAVKLDGVCDVSSEYSEALAFQFTDATVSGTVYLKQEATHLFVCLEGILGTDPRRFASVYLDTDNGREKWAEGDDYSLRVDIITRTESSWVGTGVSNGYTATTLADWTAVTARGDYDVAEYKIPITLTGGICNAPFGIAVYHHWVEYTGDDYGWPSPEWFDQPQTWQTAEFETPPCPNADLSLTKYDDPDPVTGGTLLTYTLVVDNGAGPDTAYSIKLTDTLPAEVTFIPDMSDERCSEAYGTVTCDLGDLDQGWNTTVYIVVIPPASGGTITNTATVTAKSFDGKLSNNTATASTTVNPAPIWADLSVTKSDTPDPVMAGMPLTYTIVVHNDGPYSAPNVVVNDTLPSGVNTISYPPYCSQIEQDIVCALENLDSKTDTTIVIVVSPKAGTVVNTVTVGSDATDPDTSNNTATASTIVNPRPADLSVSKTDLPDPVTAGDLLTYTITINNAGPGPASGIMLTDTLTPAAPFVSATPAGQCSYVGGTVTCNVDDLTAGSSATVRLVFRPTIVGELLNQVQVSAAAPDPNTANNVDTEYTVVTQPPRPDITIYGLEITQGIQNLNSDMPLVANRVTRARGYARTTGSDLPNVRARLWAIRNGANLPHSPVEAMWPPTPVHPGGANRLNVRDAFFFYIWPEWQSGTVTFRLEVNYDHAVAESNYTNNTWEKTVTFFAWSPTYQSIDLNVVVRPLGLEGRAYYHNDPTFGSIVGNLARYFPISRVRVWYDDDPMGPMWYCLPFWDASTSLGRSCMLLRVNAWDDGTSDPSGAVGKIHWVGTVHPAVNTNQSGGGTVTGQAWRPGKNAWVKMDNSALRDSPWLITGGNSFAHELGHNQDLKHVNCSGTESSGGDVDPSYPWPIPYATQAPYCRLAALDPNGYYGLDVLHGDWRLPWPTVISNNESASQPNQGFALMGYLYPSWISPWEYCKLLQTYHVPCNLWTLSAQEKLAEAVAANPIAYADPEELRALYNATEYLAVSGIITLTDNTAQFINVARITNPLTKTLQYQAEKIGYREGLDLQAAQGVTYTLVQLDGSNTVLSANEITLNAYDDDVNFQPFSELLPLLPGAVRLQVREGANVLADRVASANPPVVTLLTPNGGGSVGTGSVVRWSASDPDDDTLAFDILYSNDNGAHWRSLTVGITGNVYTITSVLPGATQGLMRVVAMDGFHSAEDVSDGTFTVAGNAPLATIITPFDGMTALPGSPVEFRGTATDLEDGPLSDGQLVWTSSRDGALGTGEVVALDTLSFGQHRITLTATDGDGQTNSQNITIFIGYRIFLPVTLKQ